MAEGYLNSGETFTFICDGCGELIESDEYQVRGWDRFHVDCAPPPNIPSREFLVRQAILNAVPNYLPYAFKAWGVAGTLRRLMTNMPVSYAFEAAIKAEFKHLYDQWAAM